MIIPNIDSPNLPLQALFDTWPAVVAVFRSRRMLCFGCPIAPFHTVDDACLEYGLEEVRFRRELRASIVAVQR